MLAYFLMKCFYILHNVVPAIFICKKSLFDGMANCVSMTKMVVSNYYKAFVRKKRHKVFVPVYVVCNSVRNLYYSPRSA